MNSEWIATEWSLKTDFESHSLDGVTINRMNSPFYEGERFAVRRFKNVLNKDGDWEYEPQPSSRDDDFYARCRFDSFDDALAALARESLSIASPAAGSEEA